MKRQKRQSRIDEERVKILTLNNRSLLSTSYTISTIDGDFHVDLTYKGDNYCFPLEFETSNIQIPTLRRLVGLKWIELHEFDTDDECGSCDCNLCSCNHCPGFHCNGCVNSSCNDCSGCNNCFYSYDTAVRLSANKSFYDDLNEDKTILEEILQPFSKFPDEKIDQFFHELKTRDEYRNLIRKNQDSITVNFDDYYVLRNLAFEKVNYRRNVSTTAKINIVIKSDQQVGNYQFPIEKVKADSSGCLFWKNHLKMKFTAYDFNSDRFITMNQEFELKEREKEKAIAYLINTKAINTISFSFVKSDGVWSCEYQRSLLLAEWLLLQFFNFTKKYIK
jgi:hypothetical protein